MQPVIPAYVAPVILGVLIVLAAWVARTVARAAADANLPARTRTRVTIAATLALGAWLLAVLLRAPAQAPVDAGGRGIVPAAFAVFGVLSFAAVFGALALSDAWRRTVAAIPVERLVAVQTFRVVGFVFVALWAIGSLPGRFALPAGLGDIAVGLAAPFVAVALARRTPGSRALALAWNTLGVIDLVTAVGLGTGLLVRLFAPGTPLEPAAAMTMFPLVLVPTFGVPLAMILHVLTYQALARSGASDRRDQRPLSPHAAAAR
jgi:hypothetical protein